MPLGPHAVQGSLLPRHHLSRLGAVALIMLVLASLSVVIPDRNSGRSAVHAAGSFTFTAAGDYGQTKHSTAVLQAIASAGGSFHLALGDLNYDYPNVSADQWSSYAKGYVGSNFPFEILYGEHDTGDISQLAADLPNRMAGLSGTYPYQYYFDYPAGAPLARILMLSPGLAPYKYDKGNANYNWVASAIDSARAAHIPWVIVGEHKYCIVIDSSHTNTCSGQDLMNLLLSKRVDLILQGQKHGYQASKQLALNTTTCTSLSVASYKPSCVVGASSSPLKGAGSVITICGTGGKSLALVDASDPEAGYFRTWMGGNANPTWGMSKITVSATQLHLQFVAASGGTFSDSLTIHS